MQLPLRGPLLPEAGESLLPVLIVEEAPGLHRRGVVLVEAPGIHTVIFRVVTRLVEGVDTAMTAEGVLGGTGAEYIGGHLVGTAHDFQAIPRDRQMQNALFGAH